jgi:quercetin dioxygenase-like cupin family protein
VGGVAHLPNGQATTSLGRRPVSASGGSAKVIRPGDRVFFEPGEEHWHITSPNRFMSYLTMLEVDDF